MVIRNQMNVGGTENGYVDDETSSNWSKYDPNRRAILFLDGHITRNNKEIMKLFKNAPIKVIIFSSHFTHLIQPFDTTVARPLKQALKRLANDILENLDSSQYTYTEFLRLSQVIGIIDAIRVATIITNCKIILGKTGIKKSIQSFIDFFGVEHIPH